MLTFLTRWPQNIFVNGGTKTNNLNLNIDCEIKYCGTQLLLSEYFLFFL